MKVKIRDGIGRRRCHIEIDGMEVTDCIRYQIIRSMKRNTRPQFILHTMPEEIDYDGNIEDSLISINKEKSNKDTPEKIE